jgi:hypothetical protein
MTLDGTSGLLGAEWGGRTLFWRFLAVFRWGLAPAKAFLYRPANFNFTCGVVSARYRRLKTLRE